MRKEKRLIAGLLAVIMITASISMTMQEVKATETETGSAVEVQKTVEYVDMTTNYSDYFGNQDNIPTKEGYFFGGWYKDNLGTTVIKDASEIAEGDIVYAKFVPSYVLSVKAQIFSTTERTTEGDGKTNVRLVTSLDCKKYKNVGFQIIDMSGETEREIASSPIDIVYSALRVSKNGQSKDYTAQQIFGQLNESEQRLAVLTLNNIPESKWNSDIYVRPYWTTYEGVKVYGLGKYVYVNDGLDGWISIPVNLHNGASVAAGLVDVGFDSDYLQFEECRAGRVFEEVEANIAADGSTVKCVGNVRKVENASASDMYITLRFSLKNNYEIGNGTDFLKFTMSNMNFANVDEEYVPMNILNVQY